MSRFNTGNPIDSDKLEDLSDNTRNLDLAVNSDGNTFQDRLGKSRPTWAGIVKAGSGDPAIAVDAAARAVAAAGQVEQDAERIAQEAAAAVIAGVEGAVDRAEGGADRAEAAAATVFGYGSAAYLTFADASNATGGLSDNTMISVTNDPDPDNNGLYQWDGSALTKSTYDPETRANEYTDSVVQFRYAYRNGNLIGSMSQKTDGVGLNGSLGMQNSAAYSSVLVPVVQGDILYLHNTANELRPALGYAFAFFSRNPYIVGGQTAIPDNRTRKTDPVSATTYNTVTVPDGAEFLILNTRINATDITWAVHAAEFDASYDEGELYLVSAGGGRVAERTQLSLVGDLYTPSNTLQNFYVNASGRVLTSGSLPWQAVRVAVQDGDVLFLKLGSLPFNAQFRAIFSTSIAETSAAEQLIEFATFEQAAFEGVYRTQAPAGSRSLYLNVYIPEDGLDLRDTLSIQRGSYSPEVDGFSELAIVEINGRPLAGGNSVARSSGATNTSRLEGRKVFAFGDSITQGTEGGYVHYLEAAFGVPIQNYGSSGARADRLVDIVTAGAGLPRRDASTAGTEWPTIDYTDLALATIMIGTNSSPVWGSIEEIPDGDVADYADPLDYWALFPDTYVSNIALCLEFIKWKAPEAELHIITPPYMVSGTGPARTQSLIPRIESVARLYGVNIIYGTYECGISYKGMKPDPGVYSYDGTHFNARGNAVFGRALAQKILSLA